MLLRPRLCPAASASKNNSQSVCGVSGLVSNVGTRGLYLLYPEEGTCSVRTTDSTHSKAHV